MDRPRLTIYVRLLHEGIDVWRPVEAEHVRGDLYKIVTQKAAGDEVWEFDSGLTVRCRKQRLSDGIFLVAYARGDAV